MFLIGFIVMFFVLGSIDDRISVSGGHYLGLAKRTFLSLFISASNTAIRVRIWRRHHELEVASRLRELICPACSYPLKNLPSSRCPECGLIARV